MKGPRGFAYACLPSRALFTPQGKRFQPKISQTKRMLNNYIYAAKMKVLCSSFQMLPIYFKT